MNHCRNRFHAKEFDAPIVFAFFISSVQDARPSSYRQSINAWYGADCFVLLNAAFHNFPVKASHACAARCDVSCLLKRERVLPVCHRSCSMGTLQMEHNKTNE